MLYPAQAVEYRVAEGAKSPASSAPAYRLVPTEIDKDTVADLADALGMKGKPDDNGTGGMTVRDGDTQLVVDTSHIVNWSYGRTPEGAVRSDVAVACAPDGKCPQPEPVRGLPTPAEAEAKARRILDAAGLDAGKVMESGERGTATVSSIAFAPEVDGAEVLGLVTSFQFGEDARIEYANGWLGHFDKVGDYPLVGLNEAVERMRSGFGTGGVVAMDAKGAREPAIAEGVAEGGAGSSGSAGSTPGSAGGAGATEPAPPPQPVPMPPDEPPGTVTTLPPRIVEITGADVVLHVVYPICPGDPVYVVPAFAFEPEEAGSAVAVENDDLTGTDRPQRGTPAEPCPGVEPDPVPLGRPEPAPEPVPPVSPNVSSGTGKPDPGGTEVAPPGQ